MSTFDEFQYWDRWGALKLGLAQKKTVINFIQTKWGAKNVRMNKIVKNNETK
jgi:hypothetical protein